MLSRPLLDRVAFFDISWYAILITGAIVIGYLIASGEARRLHLPQDTVIDFLLYAIPLGLICARLYYVTFRFNNYSEDLLSIFNIREGGMAIYGGVIGGLIAARLVSRKHKISMLRDKRTGTNEFRTLIEEIATLMGYEALRDLPLEEVEVETPIETCMTPVIAGKKLAVVPILRAGLGMVNGILALVPTAKVGHIGLYRDEKTHQPHEYFCKLPDPIEQRTIVVTDPMLATGGSAVAAIDFIKQHGGKHIKFMCVIAAPEGLERLRKAHPDVQIYVGHLDRQLNEKAYICPGLGDAGDRIFGTK